MGSDVSGSPDAWMARNLNCPEAARLAAMHGAQYSNFRLRVLPAILFIASLVIITMWYQEARLGVLTTMDSIAFPPMLFATLSGAMLLKLRPALLRPVIAMVFIFFTIHILGVYYEEMFQRISGAEVNHYDLLVILMWLPLGYVAGFVFFSPPPGGVDRSGLLCGSGYAATGAATR